MTTFVGIASHFSGVDADRMDFVAVSDGQKTQVLLPIGRTEAGIEDILTALGSRVSALDSSDPEDILQFLVYNMYLTISISDPFDSYEDAIISAQHIVWGGSPLLDDSTDVKPYDLIIKNPSSEDRANG